MATTYTQGSSEGRSWASSPRPKGRADHARNIPCRNIQIYGYCKHEKDGCMYNHDAMKTAAAPSHAENLKKRFNVESPSFTPSLPDGNGSSKTNTISPKAASAAPFTPKTAKAGLAPPAAVTRSNSAEWSNSEIPEFVPQGYQQAHQHQLSEGSSSLQDPFASYDGTGGYSESDAAAAAAAAAASINPYAQDATNSAAAAAFFQQPSAFSQPLQYHLYAPVGPHRENLLAYQRSAHDFFIAENLRQEFQRKAEASLQVLPNSNLPANIEYFHSLVPLDTSNQKNTNSFGYNSWVYKATSGKDGNVYVLRRIENFRVTNDKDIGSVKAWKRIANASMVTILDCFTTRAFGDSSLVFVTDYHPLSKTIAEQHFSSFYNPRQRAPQLLVPEQSLWGYLVQLTSALKVIHGNGLAARLISPTKVIVTNKNRIRLNCCGILDVVQPAQASTLAAQQLEDIRQIGRLMLALATNNPNAVSNAKTLEVIGRTYSERFRSIMAALMDASPVNPVSKDINTFMSNIADQVFNVFDTALHYEDAITSELYRELESSRLVRLMVKLGFINERPEFSDIGQSTGQWSETGERYYLKLFRDYVFHQVNAEGRPVVDLGHVLTSLNKLDAGSDEKIVLTSRDEQNVFVVTYKEIKRSVETAFQELSKTPRRL
ncbi:hypothetical protein FH972_026551 [Carpinus fangiana]|uniref:PAN2-PAN3 deadenylation complex subunit PAN3 n=1 Tax=Carpinus fangiana TaxID=176857 RepID=A0A5N6L4S5_9ROSI|nr:hypothetical protein FH972_026551 [Carpinus fangiana]